MQWLKDVNDAIYTPEYTDMLRVAFTSQFKRGKLQDLVALYPVVTSKQTIIHR